MIVSQLKQYILFELKELLFVKTTSIFLFISKKGHIFIFVICKMWK